MNKFLKLHSSGNDFLIFFKKKSFLYFLKNINKKTGISADQIFFIKNINYKNNFIKINIFNKDGSKAKNCGNGIRSLSWFFLKNKKNIIKIIISKKYIYSWKIKKNIFNCFIISNKIFFLIIKIKKIFIRVGFFDLNNLHLIVLVKNINSRYIYEIEKEIRKIFLNFINIEFVQIINKNESFIRIFERGVGETLSCGTGIISSFYYLNNCYNFKKSFFYSPGGYCLTEIFNNKIVINSKIYFCCFGFI